MPNPEAHYLFDPQADLPRLYPIELFGDEVKQGFLAYRAAWLAGELTLKGVA